MPSTHPQKTTATCSQCSSTTSVTNIPCNYLVVHESTIPVFSASSFHHHYHHHQPPAELNTHILTYIRTYTRAHIHTYIPIDTPANLFAHLDKRACWAVHKTKTGPVTSLHSIADRCLEPRRKRRPGERCIYVCRYRCIHVCMID